MAQRDIIAIFGGSGGIGTAVCKEYLAKGHQIIVLDRDAPASDLKPKSRVSYIPVNVTNESSLEKAQALIQQKYGRLTHLISLAGEALSEEKDGKREGEFQGIVDCKTHFIRASIDLNLTSHAMIMHYFTPLLQRDAGPDKSIVLISSINAQKDYGCPAYSAAKAGLYGLRISTSNELSARGIRINTVSPGTVMTPRTLAQPKDFDHLRKGTLLGRLTTPEDVAAVIYSFSHIMRAVTNQDVAPDCGQMSKAVGVASIKPAIT